MVIFRNLEHNTELLIQLMKQSNYELSDEELRAITVEKELAEKIAETQIKPGSN